MAKRRREEADSDDGAAIVAALAASYHAVFIDTDLDTHLAMMVSNIDTVSDLKKKISFEHLHCFPEMGEIKIHSVKVKRKGNFYYLPDSMLVRTAFEGTQRNWFLYVAGSVSVDHTPTKACHMHDGNNQMGLLRIKNYDHDDLDYVLPDDPSKALAPEPSTFAVSRGMGMDTRDVKDEHCRGVSSDTSRSSAQRNVVSTLIAQEKTVTTVSQELKDDKSGYSSKGKPSTKRQKLKHGEEVPNELALEGGNGSQSFQMAGDENTAANSNGGVPVHIKVKGKSGGRRKHTRRETGAEVSSAMSKKFKNRDNNDFTEAAETGPAAFKTGILEDSTLQQKETIVVDLIALKESLEDDNLRSDSECRESKRKSKNALKPADDLVDTPMHGSQIVKGGWNTEINLGVTSNSLDNSFDASHVISLGTQCNENEKAASRKSHVANSKECPPPVIEECHNMDITINHPTHEGAVFDSPRCNADLANTIEDPDLITNNDAEPVLSPKSKPSDQGERLTSLKHLLTSSNLSDAKGVEEHGSKRKKKKKRSNARIQHDPEMKHNDELNSNTSMNFTTDHATDEIRKDESSVPSNQPDMINSENTLQNIEAELTNNVGNESTVLGTCDPEKAASEICPPSDHVQTYASTKGETEHDKRPKKKKSKEISVRIHFDPDTANMDQEIVPEFDTDLHRNHDTRKNETMVPNMEAGGNETNEKEENSHETCNPKMETLEMSLPARNEETVILSSKLDSIKRNEGGNTERTKKRKRSKKTAGKSQYTLEKADGNDLVNGISSPAVNGEFSEPATHNTAKIDHMKPQAQTSQTITALEKEEPSEKHIDMQSANCISPVCDKADLISENPETASSAQLSNDNATEKHGNSVGSRKKRKSKKSANVALGPSGLPAVGHFIDGSKDQILSHCMEVENASNKLPIDTSAAGSCIEIDKVNESVAGYLPVKEGLNEDGPLQVIQSGTSHLDAENTVRKAKRKSKRNSSAAGECLTILAKNDNAVGVEKLAASNEKMLAFHDPHKAAEVSGTAINDHFAQVAVTDIENPESVVHKGQTQGNPDDYREMQPQAEVSTENGEGVNFRHYFVPGSQQDHGSSADKVIKTVKLNRDTKAGKKSAKDTVPSISGGWVNSQSQDENVDEHMHSSSTKLGKSKYDKQDKVKLHSNKKSLKVAETDINAVIYSNDDGSNTLQEAENHVLHGSESQKGVFAYVSENKKSFDESSSTSSVIGSQKFIRRKKDRSQSHSNHQSLASKQDTSKITEGITTPTATLRDKRSHNYGDDENGPGLYDSSTRTPSSDSSSYSSSVDGSESGHHSTRNGFNGANRNNSRREFNLKSKLSMDKILRGSKRFKKAKQKAAQIQLDSESQPVDFVPESQPN